MSQRECNPIDAFVWGIAADSPVWVAERERSAGPMQLQLHKMKEIMHFASPAGSDLPTFYQPDYSLPRMMPLNTEPGTMFMGMMLRFAAPEDGNSITNESFAAIYDVRDMPLHEMTEAGYMVFYTGNRDFPFIVCRSSQVYPVIGQDDQECG